MASMSEVDEGRPLGVRGAKKAATRARIADAGLRLFRERGYEGTTLDAIAESAGISRRTFFYYFASKDEVLLAWDGAGRVSQALGPALRSAPQQESPLLIARECLVALTEQYETPEAKDMDRLMRSSDSLRVLKGKAFAGMELALLDGFAERWPDPARKLELSTAAMIATGLLRISIEAWHADESQKPLADHLQVTFDLATEIMVGCVPPPSALPHV